MRSLIRWLPALFFCLFAAPLRAGDGGWVSLFDGQALDAWRGPTGDWQVAGGVGVDPKDPKRLVAQAGSGVMVNGPKGNTNNLVSKQAFGDVEVHVEFLIPKGANSGVKLEGLYEIQIYDSYGVKQPTASDCGGIYPRAELLPRYHHIDKGIPPRTNAARPAGEWQTLDIIFLAPRFDADRKKTANARFVRVVLNGTVVHANVEVPYPTGHAWHDPEVPTGPLLLQADHGPVAFRNVRARPYQAGKEGITWRASGSNGAVSAGGKDAVAAGIEILQAGGNAADAAAATILALSVTDSTAFCFGGEAPILVYDAQRGSAEVLAGQGAAPRLATREHFAARGGIPGSGVEAAAVPSALDAVVTMLDRHGTRTFAEVASPALRLLDAGQKDWHADLARTLRRLIDAEKASPHDRGRGLRLVADYFYRGPLARELDAWCRANGGLIRFSDLATHVTRVEDPASVDYRGYTVCKCGPWTQGPYLLEALQLLEGFDLKQMGHNRPDAIHVTVEAMKLAFADRDVYYGDPLFVDVPLDGLLSSKYAELRRPLIDRRHASLVQRPGDPRGAKALLDEGDARRGLGGPAQDTTTCVVADGRGNVIAATPSGWSGVLAGRTGVWLGSRLQSFNTWKGHPNCIEPGKRPRITLTPTLVLKDGRPVLAVSVAGGDGQDQAGLQMLLNCLDFGLSPADAVTAPRFGTDHFVGSFRQKPPVLGSLLIYPDVGEQTTKDLQGRGHKVTLSKPPLWAPSVIRLDPKSGILDAAGDPKARRHAAAY